MESKEGEPYPRGRGELEGQKSMWGGRGGGLNVVVWDRTAYQDKSHSYLFCLCMLWAYACV